MALTLGIIGAGHMGTLHAQNLMTDERVHLVGVTDVDQDRAETLARLVNLRGDPHESWSVPGRPQSSLCPGIYLCQATAPSRLRAHVGQHQAEPR